MDLLKVFSNKTTTPKDVAKDRLKLILIHDRGDIDPETIDKIRMEILQVLSKYIEIEADDVEIQTRNMNSLLPDSDPGQNQKQRDCGSHRIRRWFTFAL